MKLKLKKRNICEESKKNILPLKHDRYLARVHTLIGTCISFIISLGLFLIAGILEEFFSLDKDTIFVFSVLVAISISVSLTLYLNWKSIRMKSIDSLIDLYEPINQ